MKWLLVRWVIYINVYVYYAQPNMVSIFIFHSFFLQNNMKLFTTIEENTISMFVMVPQYIVITVGEILFSITGLSFGYSQVCYFKRFYDHLSLNKNFFPQWKPIVERLAISYWKCYYILSEWNIFFMIISWKNISTKSWKLDID